MAVMPAFVQPARPALAMRFSTAHEFPMDEEKRERIIAYIRHRMDEYDISLEQLTQSLAEDEKKIKPILFRDAYGNTWNGDGDMPDWLRRAVHAGQSIEHFMIASEHG